MKPTPSPQRRRGFSLMEIMIVVVIIAMLSAIGLPAFFSTMKRAEWAKVQSQMKSILSAIHSYASENDEYIPPAWYPNGPIQGSWLDTTIFAYVHPESGFLGIDDQGNDVKYDAVNGVHLRDTVFMVKASVDAFPEEENFYNHTFLMNRSLVAEVTAVNPEFAPRKRTMFEEWTSVMLLTEGLQGDHNSVSLNDRTQVEEGLKRYDGKFVHFGFLDGHVEQVRARDLDAVFGVSRGAATDPTGDAWHTAWFGFSPDRIPSATQKPVLYR